MTPFAKLFPFFESRNGVVAHCPELFGFFCGLALFSPLLGQFAGLSSRFAAVVFFAAALGFFYLHRKSLAAPNISKLFLVGLLFGFGALVFRAASSEQILLIFAPATALANNASHYATKLIVFLASYIPELTLFCAYIFFRETSRIKKGFLVSLVILTSVMILRIGADSSVLIGADYQTALAYYVGTTRGPYSMVSASLLLSLGTFAGFYLLSSSGKNQYAWGLFVGICLFIMFWMGRRADTVFCSFFLITYALIAGFHRPALRKPFAQCLGIAFAAAALLAILLNNASNSDYWRDAGKRTLALRLSYLDASLSGTAETLSAPHGAENFLLPPVAGLGRFAQLYPDALYPHNIFAEALYELGGIAFFFLAVLFGGTVFIGFRGVLRGLNRPEDEILWLCTGFIMLNSLFAGDLTSPRALFFLIPVSLITKIEKISPEAGLR